MDELKRSHAYQWQRLWALTVCLNERRYWTSLALSHAPSLSLCSGQTQFPAPVSRKWDAVCFFISVLSYVLMASVFVSLYGFIFCIPKNKSQSCIEWHIWTDSNIGNQIFISQLWLYFSEFWVLSINLRFYILHLQLFFSEFWIYISSFWGYTLLKIKGLYWHQWFHKEPLPSMETFHSTKVLYSRKRFFRLLKYSSYSEKVRIKRITIFYCAIVKIRIV